MSYVTKLKCIDCGREYSPEELNPNCPECGKRDLDLACLTRFTI